MIKSNLKENAVLADGSRVKCIMEERPTVSSRHRGQEQAAEPCVLS